MVCFHSLCTEIETCASSESASASRFNVDQGVVKHVAESGTPEDAAADAPGANANSAVKGMLEAIAKL